jgi:hypothetical protein
MPTTTRWLFGMCGDQFVQSADAGESLRQPPRRQPLTGLIHQINVVMLFGPVIAD